MASLWPTLGSCFAEDTKLSDWSWVVLWGETELKDERDRREGGGICKTSNGV